jgi:hypothetical protein
MFTKISRNTLKSRRNFLVIFTQDFESKEVQSVKTVYEIARNTQENQSLHSPRPKPTPTWILDHPNVSETLD